MIGDAISCGMPQLPGIENEGNEMPLDRRADHRRG